MIDQATPSIHTGKLVLESELPEHLRARIARARACLVEGRAPRVGSGAQVEDGGLWFADGTDLSLALADELRLAFPAIGFLAGVATGLYAAHLFSESDVLAWLWVVVTLAFVAGGIAVATKNLHRASEAGARMELGTLLLPDLLIYMSYGRAVVIPRAHVVGTSLVSHGTEQKEKVRTIHFRGPEDGQVHDQSITGFFGDDAGLEQLRRWIAEGTGGSR